MYLEWTNMNLTVQCVWCNWTMCVHTDDINYSYRSVVLLWELNPWIPTAPSLLRATLDIAHKLLVTHDVHSNVTDLNFFTSLHNEFISLTRYTIYIQQIWGKQVWIDPYVTTERNKNENLVGKSHSYLKFNIKVDQLSKKAIKFYLNSKLWKRELFEYLSYLSGN